MGEELQTSSSPINEVDPTVGEVLKALLWLQEKTCGGVELGASRGQIIARVGQCTMEFFNKLDVREKFPPWVEYGFFYKGNELLRIEIHFGKNLAMKEYDLMMGWGAHGKED